MTLRRSTRQEQSLFQSVQSSPRQSCVSRFNSYIGHWTEHFSIQLKRFAVKREPITQIQQFALEMLFRALKVNVHDRTMAEYVEISQLIPASMKVVTSIINNELARYSQTEEFKRREFTRFTSGDKIVHYERYPTTVSLETVRKALINSRWRELQELPAQLTDNACLFQIPCTRDLMLINSCSFFQKGANNAKRTALQRAPTRIPYAALKASSGSLGSG
jgi:hypothetical protein